MSLRVFHLIFITSSTLVVLGFSFWAYANFQQHQLKGYFLTAAISLICAAGLVAYEISFFKKTKD